MQEPCQFAARCPIAKYFTDQGWKAMLRRYCYGHYERCHRYEMTCQNQPVAEHIMPWDGTTELYHS